MAKIPMQVIPKPPEGTRQIWAAKHAGSMAIKGNDGSKSFLCGNCRDILAKSSDPDAWVVHRHNPAAAYTDKEFTPLYRVRDLVFKCKNCGAYNEVAVPPAAVDLANTHGEDRKPWDERLVEWMQKGSDTASRTRTRFGADNAVFIVFWALAVAQLFREHWWQFGVLTVLAGTSAFIVRRISSR